MSRYFKMNNLEVKQGNFKLGLDTLIYSLSSARNCISKHKGLCKVPNACYALDSEIQYPNALPYRVRQNIYFSNNSAEQFISDIKAMFKRYHSLQKQIEYLRWNESGDIRSFHLPKMIKISKFLYDHFNIVSYTYTCRSDLNIPDLNYFLVKGSACDMPNGKSIVIGHKDTLPKNYVVCPTTCRTCVICKRPTKVNIAFKIHGNSRKTV